MNLKLYESISNRIARGVTIQRSLCFYNPQQVYDGLMRNKIIKNWHSFMIKNYEPPKKDFLLIYPCTTIKPYDLSRSYKQLYHYLEMLKEKRNNIQVMTISEPFGLVPEEYYSNFKWYDCPGLFQWWCNKHGQKYDRHYLDKSIELLADNVGLFLKKVQERHYYKKIIGFVRTYSSNLDQKYDHTHRRILELAVKRYKIEMEILPRKNEVKDLVDKKGKFAWDMYGVAHPTMLNRLIKKLENC